MVQTSRLAASLVGLLGFAGIGLAAPLDGRARPELTDEYCRAAAEQHYMPGMYQCAERNRGKNRDKREPKTEVAEWLDPQELCERGPLEYWWCEPLEEPEKREPKGGPDLSQLQKLCDNGDIEDWWCKKLPKHEKRDDEPLGKVVLAAPKGDDEDEQE